jgi:hypothetical protein
MKSKHVLAGVVAFVAAAAYIENFYKHPTFGNGLRAFFAAASAAKFA